MPQALQALLLEGDSQALMGYIRRHRTGRHLTAKLFLGAHQRETAATAKIKIPKYTSKDL